MCQNLVGVKMVALPIFFLGVLGVAAQSIWYSEFLFEVDAQVSIDALVRVDDRFPPGGRLRDCSYH